MSAILGCSEYGPVQYITNAPTFSVDTTGSFAAFAMLYIAQRAARGIAAFPDGGIPKVEQQGVWTFWCDENARQIRFTGLIEQPGMDFQKHLTVAAVTNDAFTLVLIPFNRADTVAYRVQVGGGVSAIPASAAADSSAVPLGSFCRAAYDRLKSENLARNASGAYRPPADTI